MNPTAHVPPGLLDLLDRLSTPPARPAQVVTDLHETLAQNEPAAALFGRLPPLRGPEAGLVYRWFTDPAARALYPAEERGLHSRVLVADLRAAWTRRGGPGAVGPEAVRTAAMVAELRRRSEEFAALWDLGADAPRRTGRRRVVHPTLGVIELDCHCLFSEDGRQRLQWFSAPPGTGSAARLELLCTAGPQDVAGEEQPPRRRHGGWDPSAG